MLLSKKDSRVGLCRNGSMQERRRCECARTILGGNLGTLAAQKTQPIVHRYAVSQMHCKAAPGSSRLICENSSCPISLRSRTAQQLLYPGGSHSDMCNTVQFLNLDPNLEEIL